jgi:hypothetical protein
MGDDEGDREGDDGLDRLERERGKGGKLEKWCKGVLRGHKKVRASFRSLSGGDRERNEVDVKAGTREAGLPRAKEGILFVISTVSRKSTRSNSTRIDLTTRLAWLRT